MKKLNIQRDLDSRAQIAAPKRRKPVIVESEKPKQDGKTEEAPQCADHAQAVAPASGPVKKARKTTGDL